MGIIRKLDEPLANKIAAGEVVERPASIVKELVENALDAEASAIQVDVEEGGLTKIKITDNGHGFAEDDCDIAFERHATSKISEENDLFHIKTLGFRGEALPSIASVSHLELKTCTGEEAGTHLVLQGGHIIQSGHTASRRGTEITVSNLFFNTPARLKHLKTVHTELGKISDIMNKLALSYPEVRFGLTHNEKPVFQTNGKGDLRQVLAAIYGMQTAKASLQVRDESLDFQVRGLLVKPEVTRAGRQYVYIFINGRYIRNYPIFNAIMAGYHTLLPIGRYPIAVLHIEMDPTLIDVNVHPAKLEARISKEKELCQLIEQAVRETFHQEQLIPSVQKRDRKESVLKPEQQQLDFDQSHAGFPEKKERKIERQKNATAVSPPVIEEPAAKYDQHRDNQEQPDQEWDETIEQAFHSPESSSPVDKAERMPRVYPIGQMHGTYILAQNENGLYIIDQHAAQERIKYEFYREKVGETAKEVQELLVPMTFEFTPSEYTTIGEYEDYLKQIGLAFEPFGQHSYIIRSHPQWFPNGKEKETIEDIVGQLLENRHISIKKLREELAIMMSCKKSIKANRYLRADEIDALLKQLKEAEDPFTCPHGRPVIVHFSTYEMEKLFKRVM
ncbi:DNA mismatch repair protein MutL [Scopulibacillus darangshiensis]|uniref:DNA mismatch repair protein MutL n=1 Tax=Scopulibacillus darangshiensis TaxID=442528 RepID=A0A4R2P7R9_9BACL|nr:DNA mismatch repair endonuclease MutL [Scopulibacillus darangshiensis]TCP30254.1 DNA mismatch repair protein MutL [Scopulibacillus darangshiensis]